MKFKVGQKVRVKEWSNMPEWVLVYWGMNGHVGNVGVVVRANDTMDRYNAYDVKTENSRYDFFCFEGELESIIKVGEQLLFGFMS